MSFKSIVRELRELKDGIGSISRRGMEGRHWRNRTRSHIAPDVSHFDPDQQGQWANLPSELLLDIIRRVEESETSWPARTVVVFCASVCKSWREVTKEIVKTPEECAEDESDKLLLAAKRTRRATSTDFIISLVADDFSRASSTYVGKLRTKFTVYDSQPPSDAAIQHRGRLSRRFSAKQVSPAVPACNYSVATINYELNVLQTRGPRRMHCAMHSIPFSSIQEGGSAPTPKSFPQSFDEKSSPPPVSKTKEPTIDISSPGFSTSKCQCLLESHSC